MIKKKLKKKWKVTIVFIILLILLLVYSFFIATKGLIIKEYKVEDNNLPNSFYGLKIVHFSDLYFDKSINENELSNIIDKINLTKPDIVIFSGDLLDKDTVYTEDIENTIVEYLLKINSTYGNY
nr:metallophosphoesterase [Bacilli bacterium]